ncbi:peptidoglycan-binding domain-containing protein [Streptomyces sp. KR80]|uniref:peptidoglycan-binding domain-containing protein n=1 Tax=Streptomyces sp. KR80 TaxID=3457426 RepID=UPI003FCF2924
MEPGGDEGPRGRGRRKAAMTASAVAFAVLGVFLLTTGLSDDDTRSGDESTPRNPTQVATNDTSLDVEETGTPSGSADAGTPTASAATASSSAETDKDTGGAGGGGASKEPKPPAGGGNPTDGGETGNVSSGGSVGGGEAVPPVLKEGDHGPEVVELQKRLWMSPADGVYDEDVTRRVRRFQRRAGIKDDPPGVYGPSTRKALESASSRPDHEDDDDD